MTSKIASDVDYTRVDLNGLREVLAFCKDKVIEKELTIEDFGVFSRRRFEGAKEETILQFTDGSILLAQLFDRWDYSELTPGEETHISYTGLTPKHPHERAQ